MGPVIQFRVPPLLSRTESVRIQERRIFVKKPKQHSSLPIISKINEEKTTETMEKEEKEAKNKPVCENDEKWNPLRSYLNDECKRRKEMVRSLNYKDFAPINASTLKELRCHHKDSSFCHLHMMLLYHSNQKTSSYKRPQTRVGYVQKPTEKASVKSSPLQIVSPSSMSPLLQKENESSRLSSSDESQSNLNLQFRKDRS